MQVEKTWNSLVFLRRVPIMKSQNGLIEEPVSYFKDKYNGVAVRATEVEDYEQYLLDLERNGFFKNVQKATSNGLVFDAVFRKEELLLSVLYIKPQKTTYIYVTTDRRDYPVDVKLLFEDVPIRGKMTDCGAGNYIITNEEVEKTDYEQYLVNLQNAGFCIFAKNNEGINDNVFNTTFTKDNRVLTVVYLANTKKMTISAGFDLPLSEHLVYDTSYVKNNVPEAKTKLHMLELYHFGNCFILQLKNNHFVLFDAGSNVGFEYLYDYLDSLCLQGEKPVIEAWFISHSHGDHCGALRALIERPEFGERVLVDGIYYNEPNDAVVALDALEGANITWLKESLQYLTTTKGGHPKIYRPQTGQKFYFHDVVVDIVLAQEQLPIENYSGEFNDSSTWCMLHIEGQKCLLGGDGDKGGMLFLMSTYDREFLNVEIFSLLHHGWNTRDFFTDYCTPQTVLVTTKDKLPSLRLEANHRLREMASEWLTWGDGTKVLSFPYKTGEYECLSNFKWIHHVGQERPTKHF